MVTTDSPRIAVGPSDAPAYLADAVRAGGGVVTALQEARGLVWHGVVPAELGEALAEHPDIEWVQLCHAGIEIYHDVIDATRQWTCAKGAFSTTVAEHALALALAVLRNFPFAARTRTWRRTETRPLTGSRVVIVGGGGIAQALIRLLGPFDVQTVVVHRRPLDLGEDVRVAALEALTDELRRADLVVITAPLTDATRGMIGEEQLRAMRPTSVLVNVARGGLVVAEALERAIAESWIAGAGLDVTDPEPLPDDSPLWRSDAVLISSHSANSPATFQAGLSQRVRDNVARFGRGEPLLGVVDPEARY